jgi:hypothetical protein
MFEVWAFLLPASRDFSDPQLGSLRFIDHHQSGFAVNTCREAAKQITSPQKQEDTKRHELLRVLRVLGNYKFPY